MSLVGVRLEKEGKDFFMTGIVIRVNPMIVLTVHPVEFEGAKAIWIELPNGRRIEAELISMPHLELADLVLLTSWMESPLSPTPWGASTSRSLRGKAISLKTFHDQKPRQITIEALELQKLGSKEYVYLNIGAGDSTPFRQGDSGAALMDPEGRVIAILIHGGGHQAAAVLLYKAVQEEISHLLQAISAHVEDPARKLHDPLLKPSEKKKLLRRLGELARALEPESTERKKIAEFAANGLLVREKPVRDLAEDLLVEIGPNAIDPLLSEGILKGSARVSRRKGHNVIVDILVRMGPSAAPELVRKLIEGKVPYILTKALCEMPPEAVNPFLPHILSCQVLDICWKIELVSTLMPKGISWTSELRDTLLNMLQYHSPNDRLLAAVMLIEHLGVEKALPFIQPLLSDKGRIDDFDFRWHSIGLKKVDPFFCDRKNLDEVGKYLEEVIRQKTAPLRAPFHSIECYLPPLDFPNSTLKVRYIVESNSALEASIAPSVEPNNLAKAFLPLIALVSRSKQEAIDLDPCECQGIHVDPSGERLLEFQAVIRFRGDSWKRLSDARLVLTRSELILQPHDEQLASLQGQIQALLQDLVATAFECSRDEVTILKPVIGEHGSGNRMFSFPYEAPFKVKEFGAVLPADADKAAAQSIKASGECLSRKLAAKLVDILSGWNTGSIEMLFYKVGAPRHKRKPMESTRSFAISVIDTMNCDQIHHERLLALIIAIIEKLHVDIPYQRNDRDELIHLLDQEGWKYWEGRLIRRVATYDGETIRSSESDGAKLPPIEPGAIIAPIPEWSRIRGSLWEKVERIVNLTISSLQQLGVEQGLAEHFPIVTGPYHFCITLDEENGLLIFLSCRRLQEPQRLYVEDLRKHSIANIEGILKHLQHEKGFQNPKVIRFWPWELEDKSNLDQLAQLKALEFLSSLSQEVHSR